MSSGDQSRINATRKPDQVKLGCPARIQIRDILVFTDYGLKGATRNDEDGAKSDDEGKKQSSSYVSDACSGSFSYHLNTRPKSEPFSNFAYFCNLTE